jgi:hypothetical protein
MVMGPWKVIVGTLLIVMFLVMMTLPPVVSDDDGAPSTSIPGPLSEGSTSKLYVNATVAEKGLTLISPADTNQTILINDDGETVHAWDTDVPAKGSTYMLPNGTILRSRDRENTGQDSMGVQLLDWDGTVLWNYTPPAPYYRHHDIEPLPNGNVLIITRVDLTPKQAIDIGRDPLIMNVTLWVDPIIEVRPNGTTGGDIVWIWDPRDHIVQENDEKKPNYGVVADHPELLDVNYPYVDSRDWLHLNGVDYNPKLDQIMITSRNFNEFWVIDHSTTMEEVMGHSGGAQGKGGDILYRWGNPETYRAGDSNDTVFFGPHDAQWIEPGLPGEGNILVFNNGRNQFVVRGDGKFSTVDELVPPINGTGGYNHTPGEAYGPADLYWRYKASPPNSFFAGSGSGAQRLPDGNTLICISPRGKLIVVTPHKTTVWTYQGGRVFKVFRYFPPYLEILSDLQVTEDIQRKLDLTAFMVDPDTDRDGLSLGENSSYANISGHELVLLYPEGVTSDTINLTIGDGIFESSKVLRVNVTPVNDPPLWTFLPHLYVMEDVPYTFDLGPYFKDVDTDPDELELTEDSPYATLTGSGLHVEYPNGVLHDVIGLTVSDGDNVDAAELVVNITPVNDPPVVGPIPDQVLVENVRFLLDLEPYISDIDTPLTEITIASDSIYSGFIGSSIWLIYPDGVTSDVVDITVSDGEFHVHVSFNVTVAPVNDRPLIEELPLVFATEDEELVVDIGPYISDIDTSKDELMLDVTSAYVAVDGHNLTLLYPDGINEDTILVKVSDGELSDETILVVSVLPVNDPPSWTDTFEISAVEDVVGEFDLAPYIDDLDTPLDELTVETDSSYGDLEDWTYIFQYPDGVLVEHVNFTLFDGEFECILETMVTIAPVNDGPRLSSPRVWPLGGIPGTIHNFTVTFQDVDMGTSTPVVEVVIDGERFECIRRDPSIGSYRSGVVFIYGTVLEPGNHTYHFEAEDGDGGTARTDIKSFFITEPEDRETHDPLDRRDILSMIVVIIVAVIVVALIIRRKVD